MPNPMYNAPGMPLLTINNPGKCCGMFELNVGYYDGSVNADFMKKYKEALVTLSNNASCSQMPGFATAGIKGAGIIVLNFIVPADGQAAVHDSQQKFEALFKELGARRVKTYVNPRTGKTLRLYYIIGDELRKALNK
jgi:hypothetical protein